MTRETKLVFANFIASAAMSARELYEFLQEIHSGYRDKECAEWRDQGYTPDVHQSLLLALAKSEYTKNTLNNLEHELGVSQNIPWMVRKQKLKILYEDLWNFHNRGEWICITTNGAVRSDGAAVMGAGCAKEAAVLYPQLPFRFGKHLNKRGNHVCVFVKEKIVTFPVKVHWKEQASLKLIEASCEELLKVMDVFDIKRIYLPKPGCSNGRRDWDTDVKPIVTEAFKNTKREIIIIDKPENSK